MSAPVTETLWVVMPVYNEAAALEGVLTEWLRELRARKLAFRFLVVDDGSTDGTAEVLSRLAGATPELEVWRQPNRGHGQACLSGYRRACAAEATWILQVDSDGQCDPADFGALWEARAKKDAVFGARHHRQDGFGRTVVSGVLTLVAFVLTGAWLRDANVPFRLFRRDALVRALARVPEGMHLANVGVAIAVGSDPLARLRWTRISFRERKIPLSPRGFGFFAARAWELARDLARFPGLVDSRLDVALSVFFLATLALAAWMTPRLTGGLWWDTGFHGFVEPIGARISRATPLYGEGMRLPMPPLAFLWAKAFAPTWLAGHAWILLMKWLQGLVLYRGFKRDLGNWACGIAVVAMVALSLASRKLLLYDAAIELLVALVAVQVWRATGKEAGRSRFIGLGVICAVALLTKQSTGVGIALLVALFAWRQRAFAVWAVACLGSFVGGLLVMSPWLSLPGFFAQVWQTGSEPKGGWDALITYPAKYAWNWIGLLLPWTTLAGPVRVSEHAGAAAVLVGGLATAIWSLRADHRARRAMLWFFLLAVAAAHSLSVPFFRWWDENYTLYFFSLVIFVGAIPRRWGVALGIILASTALVKLNGTLAAHADAHVRGARTPHVSALQGVWVRPRTQGLLELVQTVRNVTKPADRILLLPSDPNLEAWIERPLSQLSSAYPFPDQYWDRWVDEDFARLARDPPRVIVIGPAVYWRSFSRLWHSAMPPWGLERLVNRIEVELLPGNFTHFSSIQILYGNGREREEFDTLEVYLRHDRN